MDQRGVWAVALSILQRLCEWSSVRKHACHPAISDANVANVHYENVARTSPFHDDRTRAWVPLFASPSLSESLGRRQIAFAHDRASERILGLDHECLPGGHLKLRWPEQELIRARVVATDSPHHRPTLGTASSPT